MITIADQCQSSYIERSAITYYLDSIYTNNKPILSHFNYVLVTEGYASLPLDKAMELYNYDSILSSEITIHEFVPGNYSKEWHHGYINMSFSATLMNGNGETVKITNGRICKRFQ